jgi:hypothetical protein
MRFAFSFDKIMVLVLIACSKSIDMRWYAFPSGMVGFGSDRRQQFTFMRNQVEAEKAHPVELRNQVKAERSHRLQLERQLMTLSKKVMAISDWGNNTIGYIPGVVDEDEDMENGGRVTDDVEKERMDVRQFSI